MGNCLKHIKLIVFLLLIFCICSIPAQAKRLHKEKWYQEKHCEGQLEVVLPDRTRCDCLTTTHAIEYDFSDKWYNAVGQALYYSMQTGKIAGIVLIVEDQKDMKYWIRLNSTIKHFNLPIDTWKIEAW